MTTESPTPKESAAASEAAPSPSKLSKLMPKLKVGIFILVVIGAECCVASFYLPSKAETAEMAEHAVHEVVEAEKKAEEAAGEKHEDGEFVEVDLGQFQVTSYRPESNSTWFIDFHLFATIKTADEHEFEERHKHAEHRFREQVLMTIRSMDRNDFADAGLGLIKREILEKSNRTLGKPLLNAVVFSDFSFIEQ